MNEIDKKTLDAEDNEQGEKSGLASYVMPLAIKTLIACLVLFSLLFTLVGCFSPKAFMNMYHAFGNDEMATYYAAAAVERTGDKHNESCDGTCGFSALLTTAMSCAANTKGDKYADKSLTFAERYLALPCHEKHSAVVDNKYLQGNDTTKAGLTVLSAIYGYDDYVHGVRVKSMCSVDYTAATETVTADISNATAAYTSLLDELIAYTGFGGEYTALKNAETYDRVYRYFAEVSAGVAEDMLNYDTDKPNKKTAANIASRLSRLSDLTANLDKIETALQMTERKFTADVAESTYMTYKSFIALAASDGSDKSDNTKV